MWAVSMLGTLLPQWAAAHRGLCARLGPHACLTSTALPLAPPTPRSRPHATMDAQPRHRTGDHVPHAAQRALGVLPPQRWVWVLWGWWDRGQHRAGWAAAVLHCFSASHPLRRAACPAQPCAACWRPPTHATASPCSWASSSSSTCCAGQRRARGRGACPPRWTPPTIAPPPPLMLPPRVSTLPPPAACAACLPASHSAGKRRSRCCHHAALRLLRSAGRDGCQPGGAGRTCGAAARRVGCAQAGRQGSEERASGQPQLGSASGAAPTRCAPSHSPQAPASLSWPWPPRLPPRPPTLCCLLRRRWLRWPPSTAWWPASFPSPCRAPPPPACTATSGAVGRGQRQ